MNKEAIQKTIDLMEISTTYDQKEYFHECGTPACVAGHMIVANTKGRPNGYQYDKAAEIGGLTDDQARDMFSAHPFGFHTNRKPIRPNKNEAIAMLKRFITIEKVVWRRI